jgi:hypothetical protein
MTYEWNETKRRSNLEKHGVDFADAGNFDWETAFIKEDKRADYGEDRFIALGKIGHRLHLVGFTMRGESVRVITLRKANAREETLYESHQG